MIEHWVLVGGVEARRIVIDNGEREADRKRAQLKEIGHDYWASDWASDWSDEE